MGRWYYAQMIGKPWTAQSQLPGGDFQPGLRDALFADFQAALPNVDQTALARIFASYGTECSEIIAHRDDLGEHFGAGLFEAEVDWLISHEWASTAEDVLWRRTLLGLEFTDEQVSNLSTWMAARTAASAPINLKD